MQAILQQPQQSESKPQDAVGGAVRGEASNIVSAELPPESQAQVSFWDVWASPGLNGMNGQKEADTEKVEQQQNNQFASQYEAQRRALEAHLSKDNDCDSSSSDASV